MKTYLEKVINKKLNLVHFIGIGGTSMSGLASILMNKGIAVAGSDMRASNYTEKLSEKGARIYIGHDKKNISDNCTLVVYSAAIHSDNPEMVRARELEIPLMERSDFLGALTRDFSKTIAVSGTHGKTTTSSLIASLLYRGDFDPTVSVGGKISLFDSNFRVGNSEYFVTEACEFVDSFLKSHHSIGVILNIEEDHLDYFKDINHIKESFHNFSKIIPPEGVLIVNGDSKDVLDVTQGLDCRIITVGQNKSNEYAAINIVYDELGKPEYDVIHNGELFGHVKMSIPGEHNVMNGIAAIACADYVGVDRDIIIETMLEFAGAGRRFELRGVVNKITVIEDYAHHPTELKVTVQACQNYKYNRLWVIFQAHTYSRTYYFFDEFVDAFKGADMVVINDIYSDREANKWPIKDEDLAKAVEERLSIPAKHISKFEDIVSYVIENAVEGDFILVAGSQTINKVAYDLVDALKLKYGK
ncbi:MAG: UDP-N-acetylmuramate--L-alanine ligase [Eubacteriaceae bacterium]|nr:UDP-N-acetylmuramate--L-alanine ligase [Eubacteriaceae bacterium]